MKRYKVYFTYSPKYDVYATKSNSVFWEWDKEPVTWEDYEQVRVFVRKEFNACCVLLYTVVPETDVTPTMTPADFLRNRKSKNRGTCEPWRKDA